MLRCLCDAGVPAGHPLVAFSLDLLRRTQRPDGSWAAEDGARYDVSATIDAVLAFQRYG